MEYQTHLRARNLNVFYENKHALKDISVDIPDKSMTAIIGPSGCGKTTLLKSFNRLLDTVDGVKVTGEVWVNGDNIYDPNAEVTLIRKKMGLLSQKPSPLPMSIYDNIAYGPRIHGKKKKKELDRIVEHYLRESSLWDEVKDRLHEPASGLSLGQQQRLCLARGMAVEPEIILGDEPTSALDPNASKRIEQKFIELKDKYTIVFVTHILRQARRLADFVIFLYLGELIEYGRSENIFNDPKNEITKKYMEGVIV